MKNSRDVLSVQDAIAAWKAGQLINVFRVESEGATQQKLWGEAFDLLDLEFSGGSGTILNEHKNVPASLVFGDGLTEREKDVVRSIVAVVLYRGWAATIRSHVNAEHSPAITVRMETGNGV